MTAQATTAEAKPRAGGLRISVPQPTDEPEQPEEQVEQHVFLKDWKGMWPAGGMVDVRKGRVVAERGAILQLIALGAPIVPVSAAAGMAACPHCGHVFATGKKA